MAVSLYVFCYKICKKERRINIGGDVAQVCSACNMSEVAVSVVCNAYNHEKYIRSALEGFVMQKTTFPFEVLIHDDASTDRTAEIIREYEIKYPEIIKPIYSKENQYSKRDGSLIRIQYGRVQGKYIAICEGDDYWTDPLKLQKQYDLLESYPEIDICATAAKTEFNGGINGQIAPAVKDCIFPTEDVILGDGGFVATASLMYRTNIRKNPLPFFNVLSLDYTIQIAGSIRGGMLFLADYTCVYRMFTEGSWTSRVAHNPERSIANRKQIKNMLLQLDLDTSGKYHDVIMKKTKMYQFTINYLEHNYKEICAKENKEFFMELPIYKRLVMKLGTVLPQIADLIWKVVR